MHDTREKLLGVYRNRIDTPGVGGCLIPRPFSIFPSGGRSNAGAIADFWSKFIKSICIHLMLLQN